jgi:hypothetical protein
VVIAICSGLPIRPRRSHSFAHGHLVTREDLQRVGASAERPSEARKEADRLACEASNKRMLAFKTGHRNAQRRQAEYVRLAALA